jgi:hypothetical protein
MLEKKLFMVKNEYDEFLNNLIKGIKKYDKVDFNTFVKVMAKVEKSNKNFLKFYRTFFILTFLKSANNANKKNRN